MSGLIRTHLTATMPLVQVSLLMRYIVPRTLTERRLAYTVKLIFRDTIINWLPVALKHLYFGGIHVHGISLILACLKFFDTNMSK